MNSVASGTLVKHLPVGKHTDARGGLSLSAIDFIHRSTHQHDRIILGYLLSLIILEADGNQLEYRKEDVICVYCRRDRSVYCLEIRTDWIYPCGRSMKV